jgi:hypothetical protein
MSLQSATPIVVAFARYFTRPCCPQCGDAQLVPEQSEFAGETRVRHIWQCDACGTQFETAVEFVAP